MNIGLNQRAQRIINHSVAINATFAVKCAGHDRDVKMSFAILGALVTCM
jgi:hypothetical protein